MTSTTRRASASGSRSRPPPDDRRARYHVASDLRANPNKLDQRQAALRPGLALVERPDGDHRQVWAWPGAKQTPGPLAAHPRTVDRLPADVGFASDALDHKRR